MSEEAARAYGKGPVVNFMGTEVEVTGLTRNDYAQIDAEIIDQRGNPFDVVIQQMVNVMASADTDDKAQADAIAKATAIFSASANSLKGWRNVDWNDISNFLAGPRGEACKIWLSLRKKWPNEDPLLLDDVDFYLRTKFICGTDASSAYAENQQLLEKIDEASGVSLLGNSTGP